MTVRSRVEWADTDAAGIHHYTAILKFAEAAEAALMRRLGLDGYFGSAPRVRVEVSFCSPLVFGQEVTTTLAVEKVGSSSLTLGFEVWGEEHNGQPRRRAAAGRYVTVHVPGGIRPDAAVGVRRSAPWPPDWAAALAGGAVAGANLQHLGIMA